MNIGLLEGRDFSPEAIRMLRAVGEVSCYEAEGLQGLHDFVRDKEALFVRLRYHIGAELLDAAPRLRYLCSPTTGANHVDLAGLAARGISYVSLKGHTAFLEGIRATPEHSFGLVISLLRNYKQVFGEDHSNWDRERYRGHEIYGSRAGIIGLGRVGACLARYFLAFGASVGYYDPAKQSTDGQVRPFPSLEALIRGSDIIVLCASYEPGQPPLLDAEALRAMKGKYVVNTARGELADEEALLSLAFQGHFAGLAVDVIQHETQPSNRLAEWTRLASLRPEVILSPHIAGATFRSMHQTEEFIAQRLLDELNASLL